MNIDDMLFTIDNGKQYMVIESVKLDGKQYVYLVNKDKEIDSMFREIVLTEPIGFKEIDKKLFQEKIYPLFLEKFKNY